MVDVLCPNGGNAVFSSKGSVRRAIKEGALYVKDERIIKNRPFTEDDLYGPYLLARYGKKKHLLIKLVN